MTVDEIRDYLGVETLSYLPIDALVAATGGAREHFCLGCFNNDYPTQVPGDFQFRAPQNRHVDHSTELLGQ